MPDIVNPYDQSVVGHVNYASKRDVQEAINKAQNYKSTFATMPARDKANILIRTAQLIEKYKTNLAKTIVAESGKPIRYARGEVNRAIETFTFAADEARRLRGETIPMDAASGGIGKIGYYIRVPIGVVGAITPFNFPLNLVAHKVAPAIAVGCPIVLKPAPATPLTALRLMNIMREAGLDESAFQVVVGDADVGRWLTSDDRINMITFTGSASVAKKISQVVGLRRATYELGGNAGVIIDVGTEITDALIERIIIGGFAYSGQVCISIQRLYVHQSLYASLKVKLIARIKALVYGNPFDEATEIGPLINMGAVNRIKAWITDGQIKGSRVLVGGEANQQFIMPTLLENVPNDSDLMCNEVFGPVVNLIPYDNYEDALTQINDSDYGLQAGVYTPSLAKALLAIEKLDVGGVIINDIPTFRVDHMPYGGNKQSGVGREGPQFTIEDMTVIKTVVLNR